MSQNAAGGVGAPVRAVSASCVAAAREVHGLCEAFDKLSRDAVSTIDDPERLAELLAQRDGVLALLDPHLETLRRARSTRHGTLAGSEKPPAGPGDDLFLQVRQSLESSLAATSLLMARVAERAEVLREEIAAVNRGGSAQHAYMPLQPTVHLDSRG
jgi:hypothetical protein